VRRCANPSRRVRAQAPQNPQCLSPGYRGAERQLWRRRATPVLQDSAPFVLHEVAGVQRPPIAGDDVNRRANVVRLTVELDDRLSPYLQRRATVLACNAHGPRYPITTLGQSSSTHPIGSDGAGAGDYWRSTPGELAWYAAVARRVVRRFAKEGRRDRRLPSALLPVAVWCRRWCHGECDEGAIDGADIDFGHSVSDWHVDADWAE